MTEFTAADHGHMARALRLAERGLFTTDPNPRVGCVLVRDGRVVGEGWHQRAGGPHAESRALQAAGGAARGSIAYVTLEPCSHDGRTPPCAEALLAAGVDRVVVAVQDPDPRVRGAGLARLRAAGVETAVGLMAGAARVLNPGFFRRMEAGRPHVRVKLAASLDGRTAMASGESQWITGAGARRDVHRLRARSTAIVTGIGTVLADDPALTARDVPSPAPPARQPRRVVLDSALRTPPSARVVTGAGGALVACREADPSRRAALEAAGAEVLIMPAAGAGMDLPALLAELARREVNELLVEAGPALAGAFVAAGLVDELVVYLAPHLMGDAARPLLRLPGIDRIVDRLPLEVLDMRMIGADIRVTARLGVAPTPAHPLSPSGGEGVGR